MKSCQIPIPVTLTDEDQQDLVDFTEWDKLSESSQECRRVLGLGKMMPPMPPSIRTDRKYKSKLEGFLRTLAAEDSALIDFVEDWRQEQDLGEVATNVLPGAV